MIDFPKDMLENDFLSDNFKSDTQNLLGFKYLKISSIIIIY